MIVEIATRNKTHLRRFEERARLASCQADRFEGRKMADAELDKAVLKDLLKTIA